MPQLIPERFLFRYSVPVHKLSRKPEIKSGKLSKKIPLSEKYLLPSFAELEKQTDFATIKAGWHADGLAWEVEVQGKQEPVVFHPKDPEESDGLQIWIDTRDTQNIHRASRFCHYYCCQPNLPQATSQVTPLPIARAREEGATVDHKQLLTHVEHFKDGYRLQLWLPAECLTGYNPQEFSSLGFYYHVVDRELGEQFLTVNNEFPFAHDPSLWSTLELVD